MVLLRLLLVIFVCLSPAWTATFGTVVSNPQGQSGISDIVLDEARKRLYLVNSSLSRIDVYHTNTNPPSHSTTLAADSIRTDSTPLTAALSRSGKYLYVACYGASALDVIDLDRNVLVKQITLAASPEGVAVGFDEKVLVSTIGTGQGQAVLI